MSTDFELFPGKNLSGLFKDIYDNQQNKKQRISELIAEMKKVIRHAGDMAVIGPIIKDLVDTSVKNDDSLIKMAAIAQRIIGAQHKAEGDSGFLSDEEKEQLLQQLDETISQVADEQDVKVDELTNEIEELKQKVSTKDG
jgi:hypothetical protein|tara:strand:+ start:200 stop:619 length:420 start_codon:yes stop_codon:yes gene_type:complete